MAGVLRATANKVIFVAMINKRPHTIEEDNDHIGRHTIPTSTLTSITRLAVLQG